MNEHGINQELCVFSLDSKNRQSSAQLSLIKRFSSSCCCSSRRPSAINITVLLPPGSAYPLQMPITSPLICPIPPAAKTDVAVETRMQVLSLHENGD